MLSEQRETMPDIPGRMITVMWRRRRRVLWPLREGQGRRWDLKQWRLPLLRRGKGVALGRIPSEQCRLLLLPLPPSLSQ